ncbi:hypothetical protein L1887_42132 [Cichorium endivia]|nr:hypothetical protein L1887_42132 [Cichorium endivia]
MRVCCFLEAASVAMCDSGSRTTLASSPASEPNLASSDAAALLRKGVDECECHGLLVPGRGDGRSDPAEHTSVSGVRRCLDEERKEARTQARRGRRDDEADDTKQKRDDDVQRTLLHTVRVQTVGETRKEGEQPDGRSEQQRHGMRVTQRSHNGGEELVETDTDSDAGEHEGEHPHLDVLDGHDETLHRRALILTGREAGAHVELEPVDRHLPLFDRKELGVLRHVRQDKDSHGSNHHRDGALDDEQPLPSGQACLALHPRQDTRRNEAREGIADDTAREEQRSSRGHLVLAVEERQHRQRSREEGRLYCAQDNTNREERVVSSGCGRASRNDAPERHECGDVQRWTPELGHEQIRGDLEGDVADVEDRERRLILLALEAEISLQAVVSCRTDGVPVQEEEIGKLGRHRAFIYTNPPQNLLCGGNAGRRANAGLQEAEQESAWGRVGYATYDQRVRRAGWGHRRGPAERCDAGPVAAILVGSPVRPRGSLVTARSDWTREVKEEHVGEA